MRILSISHFDLDGFGCQFCIGEKFKKHDITYKNCGYSKLGKIINEIDFEKFDIIFITDLNISVEQQELLYNKLKNFNGKFIYIDHHQYDNGTEYLDLIKENKNFKVIIDDTKSATLKTYETLKLENENLKKLCELIDVYDMWRTEDKRFKISNYFNSWYWDNIEIFRDVIIKNNYKISPLKNELKELKPKIKQYFNENMNKLYFYDDNHNVLISFTYKYMNHFEEMFPNIKFALITDTETGISIRDGYNIKKDIQKIAKKYGGESKGHIEAYGMVIPDLKNKYQNIIKDITEVIETLPF